jgi:hypothetical protein
MRRRVIAHFNPFAWHDFRPRPIRGPRKSLIINYVTSDWRDREELAY